MSPFPAFSSEEEKAVYPSREDFAACPFTWGRTRTDSCFGETRGLTAGESSDNRPKSFHEAGADTRFPPRSGVFPPTGCCVIMQ